MVSWHTHISGKFGDSFMLFWLHQIGITPTRKAVVHNWTVGSRFLDGVDEVISALRSKMGNPILTDHPQDFKPWKMMVTPKISWFLVLAISISEVHMTATFLAPILWQSWCRCAFIVVNSQHFAHIMFEMSPWLSDAATVGSSVQSQCFFNPTAPMLIHVAFCVSFVWGRNCHVEHWRRKWRASTNAERPACLSHLSVQISAEATSGR